MAVLSWGALFFLKLHKWSPFVICVIGIGAYVAITGVIGLCMSCNRKARKSANFYVCLLLFAVLLQATVATIYMADDSIVNKALDEACGDKKAPPGTTACTGQAAKSCSYSNSTTSLLTVSSGYNSQNGTCVCTCDAACRECNDKVEEAKDYLVGHKQYLLLFLCIGGGTQLLAIFSTCCKKAYRTEDDDFDAIEYEDNHYVTVSGTSQPRSESRSQPRSGSQPPTGYPTGRLSTGSGSAPATDVLRQKLQDKYGREASKYGIQYA